ncbi:hypothetical protein SERLA73DRAFT_69507 [Serpula lacrymans var. lacrymans S7.3]|uniref:Uncharacterized protein n=2 Tax=Serpula lacrymans var. lacrymans TaxID=341189 RepID=F8PL12_SERL3|nr:uncharacterized protein SERLADRAFT_433508 [Serpula lacrymans var. lacrymans S7.9]EGO03656.1 hypothetical protein SERLA73DRAFT_69507 [Serpula lacrymans var. lacrymans S7.3]EGO29523.1 hypothetical protein SERLADRAFT_433508 [Serpula lacrymans var. lacrymans S7.9]
MNHPRYCKSAKSQAVRCAGKEDNSAGDRRPKSLSILDLLEVLPQCPGVQAAMSPTHHRLTMDVLECSTSHSSTLDCMDANCDISDSSDVRGGNDGNISMPPEHDCTRSILLGEGEVWVEYQPASGKEPRIISPSYLETPSVTSILAPPYAAVASFSHKS